MEEGFQKVKEYSFSDFFTVLKKRWLPILLSVVITCAVIGGALGCVALFGRHDEYRITLVKVDDTYDGPIVRSTLRDRIRAILGEKYAETLSDDALDDLSDDMDDHLDLTTNDEGAYIFTLDFFDTRQTKMSENDFKEVLNTVVDSFRQGYTEKIKTAYSIPFTSMSDTTLALTYYLQIDALESMIDSLIDEVETVAGMKQVVPPTYTGTGVVVTERSDFAAYYCEENGMRINDILLDLENLHNELTYTRQYISSNGIEKSGAGTMTDYIEWQLLRYPSNSDSEEKTLLENMRELFGENSPYAQADTEGKQALEEEAQARIGGIVSSMQAVMDNYNLIAESYAQYKVHEYVIISSLSVSDSGAIDAIVVGIVTAACAVVAFLADFFVQFSKLQRAGEIGVEVDEETDEPA